MADEKTIYKMKTPSGDPVRVEEAWKDASGELLTEKVNKADAQTITGLKTFSTLPQSSATPSDDKDLATKKYSDDLWSTRKAQEEKCYKALKTVTKDFTRTDPVYVRIGEDGEPEIHYTMTQADGSSFFADMDLGNATFYLHNGSIMSNCASIFRRSKLRRLFIDSVGSSTYIDFAFSADSEDHSLEEIGLFDTSKVTSIYGFVMERRNLKIIPAFDMSALTFSNEADFYHLDSCTAFLAKGMKMPLWLNSLSSLGHDAILEIFNNLGTVDKTAGITLTLGSDKLALMSDEEKAIATGKGWVLA